MLDLSFNNIRHISRVSHLAKCHTLYFVQNKIASVRPTDLQAPIAHSLRSLELGGNRLRSLDNLAQLTNLEELWVGKNKITSMAGLESLHKLRVLSIQSNRLTKLEGLETLSALEELYLSHNGITCLAGLEKNVLLNTLDFGANQVESLEGVAHLAKMSQFWVRPSYLPRPTITSSPTLTTSTSTSDRIVCRSSRPCTWKATRRSAQKGRATAGRCSWRCPKSSNWMPRTYETLTQLYTPLAL